jgi:CheY-like chemotaxis protein
MIFTSRITGTARDLGLTMRVARTADALLGQVGELQPCCIILDLGNSSLDLPGFMESLKAAQSPLPRLVAYGSHVDVETLNRARLAGCDPVLPRSKFVEVLPNSLPDWFSPK